MGCSCTCQISLSRETNTEATEEIPAPNQSGRGNHPTSNWPYKSTKSHILSGGPTACHHCGLTLTIDHMLLECAVLQECCDEYYTVEECRDEYYTADSLNTLFETTPETCIVEFLREAGFFYLIWTVRHSIQSLTWTIPKLMQLLTSRMLHSKLLEDRLWDDPRGLQDESFWEKPDSLSDMNGHVFSTLFKSVSNWQNSQLNNTTRVSL